MASEVGDRIRQARMEKGLTQDQLADLIGVGMRQVQYYEAGESDPYRKLAKIAEALNRPVGWFLYGDPDPDVDVARIQELAAEVAMLRSDVGRLLELVERLREDPAQSA